MPPSAYLHGTQENAMIKTTTIALGSLLFVAFSAGAADTDKRDPAVREAQAAKLEAKRGGLTDAGEAQLKQNRYARCDAHQGDDKEYCIRRMNGEGTVSGSVEGGGLYRELRVTVPAKQD
jgi:hypothetical protein